jgi:hypothetical protein
MSSCTPRGMHTPGWIPLVYTTLYYYVNMLHFNYYMFRPEGPSSGVKQIHNRMQTIRIRTCEVCHIRNIFLTACDMNVWSKAKVINVTEMLQNLLLQCLCSLWIKDSFVNIKWKSWHKFFWNGGILLCS